MRASGGGSTAGTLASTAITDGGALIYNEASNQFAGRAEVGEEVTAAITGNGSRHPCWVDAP